MMDALNTSPAERKLRRLGSYIAAVFFGAIFGLVVVFAVVALRGRGTLPEISANEVNAAREKWNRAAIPDYDITIVVRSRDLATYRVKVRNDIVEAAYRNDQPLRQERTLGTWSVPGMFETIELDIRAIDLHREGKAEPGMPQLLLRGGFDDTLGYPKRYQRTEMRKFGSNSEVSWEVTDFSSPLTPRK